MNKLSLWTLSRRFTGSSLPGEVKPLFFCGNGYLGVPAGVTCSEKPWGTFLNGFHETSPLVYGEKAFGYPDEKQVMIPVVDILGWEVEFREPSGEYRCLVPQQAGIEIDMAAGLQILSVEFSLDRDRKISGRVETLCAFSDPHRILSRLTLEGAGELRVTRKIASPVKEHRETGDPRKAEALADSPMAKTILESEGSILGIEESTRYSGLSYHCSLGLLPHERGLLSNPPGEENREKVDFLYRFRQEIKLTPGQPFTQTLGAVFYTSLETNKTDLKRTAGRELEALFAQGWAGAVQKQRAYLDSVWSAADVQIEEEPEQTRALRFCSYGLLQSAGIDGSRSAAAKGLSSDGYNGHYFWDADVYVQAALSTMIPEKARSLAAYRIKTLPEARQRALELAEKGALYPWRTLNGRESSAFFPAGTAQYHINADIVWGMKEYIRNTNDEKILLEGGAEMLFETARFWAGFAVFVLGKGYCFHCVTGPDEYTALVNNNFYTNLMAQIHLEYAWETALELKAKHSAGYKKIAASLGLEDGEIKHWQTIANRIYLPWDAEAGIFPQDDSFLEKSPWNWAETPKEKRPLLLHYHPLKIYRHRVMKQPDVLMAMVLNRESFSQKEFEKNYRFYAPLTSSDSSLSPAVQAAGAALGGCIEDARKFFERNLFLDLENREGNTDNGIHLAAMAGSRIAFLYGFAGYLPTPRGPSFKFRFPPGWQKLTFALVYRGTRLTLRVDRQKNQVTVRASRDITIVLEDTMVVLTKNVPAVHPLG